MKRQRIFLLAVLTLVTAFLAAGLIKIAVASTESQHPSFAVYAHELNLLENKRAVLAERLRSQDELIAQLNQTDLIASLDSRQIVVLTRLATLTDQLTRAEARTIELQSRFQALQQTRDGDDTYGTGMRLWLNAVEAAENAEQTLREKLAEEKAAASKLYRKRSAVQLLYDEFDSTEQLYAAVCRRIQKLQRRPNTPPSS